MECLMKEFTVVKQVGFEDMSEFNHSKSDASVSGDDLFVDQLLNLNDDDDNITDEDKHNNGLLLAAVKEEEEEEEEKTKPLPPPQMVAINCNKHDFGSVLSIPAEEADLQWLSQFVEESFSTFPTPYPTGFGPFSEKLNPKPESEPGFKACIFTSPAALSKARRSKRTRTGCRVWSTASGTAEASSSSSSTTTTTSSSPSSPNLHTPAKKQRKREPGSGGPGRRCSHCGVQKTPQWRAGPMGAKTLCNACGVRFKSGRLLPEYRPACSPTYSSKLHSNSHRKVLEMRRSKETEIMPAGQPKPGLPNPVLSFG